MFWRPCRCPKRQVFWYGGSIKLTAPRPVILPDSIQRHPSYSTFSKKVQLLCLAFSMVCNHSLIFLVQALHVNQATSPTFASFRSEEAIEDTKPARKKRRRKGKEEQRRRASTYHSLAYRSESDVKNLKIIFESSFLLQSSWETSEPRGSDR